MNPFCTFLLFLVSFETSSALYFHISETERRCFIEDVPTETMVLGNYRVQLYDATSSVYADYPGVGMHVEVRSPDDTAVLSKLYTNVGRFAFTSHTPGVHTICFYSNSSRWFAGAQLRVHLNIEKGEHTQNYTVVASKENLNELQLRVRQLLDQVEQIAKEQNYQRYREVVFRSVSDRTNSRVLWWSIGQTAILLFLGLWQMRHLKRFFETKKLV